ncbi:hypothetical protein BD626DRAFT_571074 [Schizophyllum amplum]|uniref:Uncharacterized protein n=1 Tax=Schizophyllum amplum TaxID=97359 RepID=A0A550C8B2_9AGAR|nr:hypothetical protein BD626DRAFT_571074 [Auriculariopsis ampla]
MSRPQPQMYGVRWAPGTPPMDGTTSGGRMAYSASGFRYQNPPSPLKYSPHQQPQGPQRSALRTDGQYHTPPTRVIPPPSPQHDTHASDAPPPTPHAPRVDPRPLPEASPWSPWDIGVQYQQPLLEEPFASPAAGGTTQLRQPAHSQRPMQAQAQAPPPASYNNQDPQIQPSPYASFSPYAPRRARPHRKSARQATHMSPPEPSPAPYVVQSPSATLPQTLHAPKADVAVHEKPADLPAAVDGEATSYAAQTPHTDMNITDAGMGWQRPEEGRVIISQPASFRRPGGVCIVSVVETWEKLWSLDVTEPISVNDLYSILRRAPNLQHTYFACLTADSVGRSREGWTTVQAHKLESITKIPERSNVIVTENGDCNPTPATGRLPIPQNRLQSAGNPTPCQHELSCYCALIAYR